jgi:hypothetical protein
LYRGLFVDRAAWKRGKPWKQPCAAAATALIDRKIDQAALSALITHRWSYLSLLFQERRGVISTAFHGC